MGAVRSLSLHAVRSRSVTDVGYAHGPFSRSAGELYTWSACMLLVRSVLQLSVQLMGCPLGQLVSYMLVQLMRCPLVQRCGCSIDSLNCTSTVQRPCGSLIQLISCSTVQLGIGSLVQLDSCLTATV